MSRRAAKNGLLDAVATWIADIQFTPEDDELPEYQLARVQKSVPVPGEEGVVYPMVALVISSLSVQWQEPEPAEGSRDPEEGPGTFLMRHGELSATLGALCYCEDDATEDEVLGGVEEAILAGNDSSGLPRIVLESDYYGQLVTLRVVGVVEADIKNAAGLAVRKPTLEISATIAVVRPVVASDLSPVFTLEVDGGEANEVTLLLDVEAETTQDAPEQEPYWPLPEDEEEP